MLKFTSFRTLVLKFFYCGKLLLQTYITFVLVYLFFVKDCFKIFLWSSYRLKERFIWMVRELCGDNLWQALLEEADIDHLNTVIFQSKENDVYFCHGCRNPNKSLLLRKNVNLKAPLRKSLSDSENIKESKLFNQIASSRILNIPNVDDETLEIRNTFCKEKTFVSVCCQCEPTYILNNQTLLKCDNEPNYSKNRHNMEFNEHRNLFKEASTSPLKCQDATPESVNFNNKIYDVSREKSKSETKLKSVNLQTPLSSSPACLMPISETPIKVLNSQPRKSRLELMFSDEKPFSATSPEKESLFRRNWIKWKRFSKFSNFKKRNVEENILSDQTSTQMETDLLKERSGVFMTIQTPEVNSCCGNMLCNFKNFNQEGQESSVTYKKF